MATLPPEVQAQVDRIRGSQMRAIEESIRNYDLELASALRREIKKLEAANYSTAAVRRSITRMLKIGDRRLARAVAEQMETTLQAAAREADLIATWEAATGHGPALLARRAEAVTGGASSAGGRVASGPSVSTEAALRRDLGAPLHHEAPIIEGPARYRIPQTKTAGFRLQTGELDLSARLHGSTVGRHQEIRQALGKIIREQTGFDRAGLELIQSLGGRTGIGQTAPGLPKILGRLKAHGDNLARLTASSASPEDLAKARRAWDRQYARVQKYQASLADNRGQYANLLHDLRGNRIQNLDRALERYTVERQRYYAERIIRTESSAAQRLVEWNQIKDNPRVIAVIWTLNSGAHRRYASRTPVPKKGKHAGSRCICEALAGERFPPEAVRDYPRMGHPHCSCSWTRVYKD